MRVTPNPARWSSAEAWSYGSPTTFGTSTGFGPFETLIRTCVPSTTTVPGWSDCAVTVPSSRSEFTSETWTLRPAAVSSRTAESRSCPTTVGTVTFGRPDDTSIETMPFGSTSLPAAGCCEMTKPSSTSELET